MGMISNYFEFAYPAPKADEIVAKISELSGLPVSIVTSDVDEIREMSIDISFDAFSKQTLELYTYPPGKIKTEAEEELAETGFDTNWPMPVEGFDEPAGKQRVYVIGYMGQERTLILAASNALVELGGEYAREIFENSKISFPISVLELKKRYRKYRLLSILFVLQTIVLLPVIIPLMVVRAILGTVKLPFKMRKAYKEVKKKYPDI